MTNTRVPRELLTYAALDNLALAVYIHWDLWAHHKFTERQKQAWHSLTGDAAVLGDMLLAHTASKRTLSEFPYASHLRDAPINSNLHHWFHWAVYTPVEMRTPSTDNSYFYSVTHIEIDSNNIPMQMDVKYYPRLGSAAGLAEFLRNRCKLLYLLDHSLGLPELEKELTRIENR